MSRSLDSFPGETLSIRQAGQVLGIGREMAYRLADQGGLPLMVFGPKKRRVPKHALRQLLETGTWVGRKPAQLERGLRVA
jgi:excisionase family DNA binding protein